MSVGSTPTTNTKRLEEPQTALNFRNPVARFDAILAAEHVTHRPRLGSYYYDYYYYSFPH